jgi:Na+-transporting NADH:ubiquinone oxidoreductase subunit NqrA
MAAPQYEGTSPLISDRYIVTFIAGEDLNIGDLVEYSGDWTVKRSTVVVGTKKFAGIVLTKAASGKRVSVVKRGICRVIAYGTLAAGDQVKPQNGTRMIADNTTLNTTIVGQVSAGAASGGTAYIDLW